MQNSYNSMPAYCSVPAEEVCPPRNMDDKGLAIARQDTDARASIPARHLEADTPASDRRENAIVPSMQLTMKVEKIQPNGKSISPAPPWASPPPRRPPRRRR